MWPGLTTSMSASCNPAQCIYNISAISRQSQDVTSRLWLQYFVSVATLQFTSRILGFLISAKRTTQMKFGGSKFLKSQNIQLMIVEVIKNEEFISEGPNPHNPLCSCSYCVHGTVM